MNKILENVKQLIKENLEANLPEVKGDQLEENGAVYYMNGKNGTEFDWYVNDHLSDFMVFYNDEQNLGAAKMQLFSDGRATIYIYGEQGNKLIKEVDTAVDATAEEIYDLAIILTNEADRKHFYDGNIEKIASEVEISEVQRKDFAEAKAAFAGFREQ